MRTFATILLACAALSAFGQREIGPRSDWRDRLYFGGGGGLNGGTDYYGYRYFYVEVSPIVGYMITQQFSAGSGISYTYIKYPDFNAHTSQYGLSPFVRYNFNQLFLTAEYNVLSVDLYPLDDNNKREIYDRLLAGMGWSQPIGQKAAINFVALYDLLYKNDGHSPFGSPWVFRVYFSF